ncbi:PIG-L deacetylase family protein [Salinicola sp. V024]|jgi:LmbE family N-acetylglucosaminyl deacetylase|uniref:PIG-L deacetylase family protein n=1 Tax=Salinicola sp. V024 TaxID=3459609 RepID=UPI002EC7B4F9|nr:PIG-L family deacetylase [Pseudomonadota bacterium]MED5501677.1 PIG-L family deacetylase [Pseudomonadota bacterium]
MSGVIEATSLGSDRYGFSLPARAADVAGMIEIELTLKARRWSWARRGLPRVTISGGERSPEVFSLEPERDRQRIAYPLPEDVAAEGELQLSVEGARLVETPRLRWHPRPALTGPYLILAPHPDDAELAAGGFYTDQAETMHIVTLSCGEKLKSMDRQYLSGLDQTQADASRRKAEWRRWNVYATPLLSGLSPERSTLIGVPDGQGWSLIHDGTPQTPAWPVRETRAFNRVELPFSETDVLEREHVLAALRQLIDTLRPETVLVTDPEFDPHGDHRATSLALALALSESAHRPANVMLYANHYRHAYPPGPAFQPAWMPPKSIAIDSLFDDAPVPMLWPLAPAMQKHKALLLDSMSDLSSRANRRQQRQRVKRAGFRPTFAAERDPYFQSAVRSTEFFRVLPGEVFVKGWLQRFEADESPR